MVVRAFPRVARPARTMLWVRYRAGHSLGFSGPFTGSAILNAMLTGELAGVAAREHASGPAGQSLSCSASLNQFAKFLARFEEGNRLRWHFDSGSGFWIACDARSSLATCPRWPQSSDLRCLKSLFPLWESKDELG